MNCHQCQQDVPVQSLFCIHCGAAQNQDPQPAAAVGQDSNATPMLNNGTPSGQVQHSPASASPLGFDNQVAKQIISACPVCQGATHYEPGQDVCPHCRSLRPLEPGYTIDPSMFQWAQDGQAMAKLRSIGPLNALAKKLSDRVGRKWIEASFNGVRLSERQMPKAYFAALRAARILGLKQMPDVYISGERPWDSHTFGSNESAFVVMGSALVSSFQGADLMFLFAREMGHILAGHALWKTVIRFLVGEHNPKSGLMRNGIAGLMDPGKWLEGAIEIPLLSWARQAEITADRAGMLAVGRMETVRRTLLSWTLKSPFLYKQINVGEWLKQQEDDSADEQIRLSEMVTSSTPYVTRRLKLISEFESDPLVGQFKQFIAPILKKDVEASKRMSRTNENPGKPESSEEAPLELPCPDCQTRLLVPKALLNRGKPVAVRCTNPDCKKVNAIQPKTKSQSKPKSQPKKSVEPSSTGKASRSRKKRQLESQNLQLAD